MSFLAISAERTPKNSGNADRGHGVVLLDLLHDVEPVRDLAEHGMHAVQMLGVLLAQYHEELAAAGVFPGVRHAERADGVLARVAGGLAFDHPARTARTDAAVAGRQVTGVGIAALHDEVRDHAVELDSVIEARVRELLEVGDGRGGVLVEQPRRDRAEVGFELRSLWHIAQFYRVTPPMDRCGAARNRHSAASSRRTRGARAR